jgi:hypothetical protein
LARLIEIVDSVRAPWFDNEGENERPHGGVASLAGLLTCQCTGLAVRLRLFALADSRKSLDLAQQCGRRRL